MPFALNLEATEKHVERVSGRVSVSGAVRSRDLGDDVAAAVTAVSAGASGGVSQAGGEPLHALRSGPAVAARPAAAQPPCWRCDKLGECKKQFRLQLTDNKPVYLRARPVPLALRTAVEREINRLEKEGSIYQVEHSDYGTPIVPIIKPSGDIRICGDYKSTINPKLKIDQYPLPRIEELFAALSGGQEFSKIDLTTAYMQVPLHPDSQACTAITTHVGFIIDRHGLHPDMAKVDAIVKAPEPMNVTQLKAFLGLVNYYGKFVPNLTSDKVLCHYEAELPVVLSVDSSAYGVGAVLAHTFPDGSERPISCASRTLSDAEKNYSQLDKEALAIMYGVQKHHQYLFGRKFTLKTDHKPLVYIFGPKGCIPQTAASRLQRWAAKLAAYDFNIDFVKSKCNGNADALSRLPLEGDGSGGALSAPDKHYLMYVDETLPVKEIALATTKDKLLSRIFGYIMFGWPGKCSDDEKAFYVRRADLNIDHGCILYKYRLVIPQTLQKRVLLEIHDGHLGIVKMKSIARNYVYWPALDKDIELIGNKCEACRSVRDAPPRAVLHPWEFPAAPWQRLHADFAQLHGKYYIILVDAHSKWLEAEEIRSTSAYHTIKFLRSLFARFGVPEKLVTDNGPPFQSAEFREFCDRNMIRHITSSPYRPQGNGAAENCVKIVKKTIKKAVIEGRDIHTSLYRFLMQYRNCEHATTGVAPAVALLGHRLRNRLDVMRPSTAKIVEEAQDKQVLNSSGLARNFKVGDKILSRNYSTNKHKWVEGKILQQTGPVSYKIMNNDGDVYRRHTDQILPRSNNRFSWDIENESDNYSNMDEYVNTRPRNRNNNYEGDTFDIDYDAYTTAQPQPDSDTGTASAPTTEAVGPAEAEDSTWAVPGSSNQVSTLSGELNERAKRALRREWRRKGME
ncbi:uncharacterized protein K02A2.6-like [Papilio machaon]|uniref:uncharacterized protein K02A2.6-like n=1 Tax=Papilio machaon TaxID=76193 RepID=UPI001E662ACB|nr:uncharacterized protein K02A2.6-like [Papilio machaon]